MKELRVFTVKLLSLFAFKLSCPFGYIGSPLFSNNPWSFPIQVFKPDNFYYFPFLKLKKNFFFQQSYLGDFPTGPWKTTKDLFFHLVKREVLEIIKFI